MCNGFRCLKWVQTCIAWDCEVWCVVLGLKLMKMCNKKQYIYFICTFMCMFYRSLFVLFLLAIVLSVLLRYTEGARVAQWVRSLDLTTHTSLSPILRGFAPRFVNYKKGCTRLAAARDKFTSCLPRVGGSLRVLRLPPPQKLVAMI